MVKKEWSIRALDREELPGFQPYLLPDTARSLERREKDVLALGLVLGHNACAAAAARLSGESAELTDLFVDEIVRHRGMGGLLLERLMERLAAEGVSRLSASYVLRGEELAAMDLEADLRPRDMPLEIGHVLSLVMGHLDALAQEEGASPLSLARPAAARAVSAPEETVH